MLGDKSLAFFVGAANMKPSDVSMKMTLDLQGFDQLRRSYGVELATDVVRAGPGRRKGSAPSCRAVWATACRSGTPTSMSSPHRRSTTSFRRSSECPSRMVADDDAAELTATLKPR
jgi:hypothetical protein